MIRTDMSNESYHLDPAISSSDVKAVYNKSLLHWKYSVRKETAAFDLGSAVHAMVLEPDRELVRRGPADRRGDKWKDAKMAADLDGIILLPEGEYDVAETIAANVLANMPAWMDRPGHREASFFARDRLADLNTKCRPDIFIPPAGSRAFAPKPDPPPRHSFRSRSSSIDAVIVPVLSETLPTKPMSVSSSNFSGMLKRSDSADTTPIHSISRLIGL